jgi:hypothetical protein
LLDGSVGQPCDHAQDSAESNVAEERCHRFLGPSEEQSNTKDRHGDQARQEPDYSHEDNTAQPTWTRQLGTDNHKPYCKAKSTEQEMYDHPGSRAEPCECPDHRRDVHRVTDHFGCKELHHQGEDNGPGQASTDRSRQCAEKLTGAGREQGHGLWSLE